MKRFLTSAVLAAALVSMIGAQAAHAGPGAIRYRMPEDGHVSLILKNADGQTVRQLVNAEFRKAGEHSVSWDGLTNSVGAKPGQAVPPGEYTWSAIWHKGIGLRLRGWAYHGPAEPWGVSAKNFWGGDQALPISAAADEDQVYLGWAGAEAGKALIALDSEDQVLWAAGYHFNGAGMIAADRGKVYYGAGSAVKQVDRRNGKPVRWPAAKGGALPIKGLWKDPNGMPAALSWAAGGLEVHDGKMYLAFSDWTWGTADIVDWKTFLETMLKDTPVSNAVRKEVKEKNLQKARDFVAGKITLKQALTKEAYWVPGLRENVVRGGQMVLRDATLVPGAKDMSGSARAEANRRLLEKAFGESVVTAYSNFVAVVDAETGKLVRRFPVAGPTRMATGPDGTLYLISERSNVLAVDPETGKTKVVLKGLSELNDITLDKEGDIYLSINRPVNQIHVYKPDGKLVRKIGKLGGRVRKGPWKPDGISNVWGIAVDSKDRLWVADCDMVPMRMSCWDTRTGKFIKEYFGPTHYGASGGAVNPVDPSILVGAGCEFRLDPKTGRATLLGIITQDAPDKFARFCVGANGRLYLAALFTGPRWGGGVPPQIRFYERVGDARYTWRSAVRVEGNKTFFWADENDDEVEQPEEVQMLPVGLGLGGYNRWSMSLNTDMTVYGVRRGGKKNGYGVQIKLGGYTSCGAPKYDLTKIVDLPKVNAPLSSPDNRLVASCDASAELFRCYDVAGGKLQWTYPNKWHGVHGSHRAPGPAPGLIRGAFGFVGNATLPKPVGAVWAINTNVGEWHVLTEDGYYLTRLFQGDEQKRKYPPKAFAGADVTNIPPGMGGEDFGGSFIQAPDGRIYIQAGKVSLWSIEVVGMDKVRALGSGGVTVSKADSFEGERARGRALQGAAKRKALTILRATPKLTGDMQRDFRGAKFVEYARKDATAVRTAAAWDDEMLYLAWDVRDPTPWINAAREAAFLYAGGDTVDFQIGTDPAAKLTRDAAVAGDLRLSIGNFNGKPAAVLYREVAPNADPKDAMTFSSGVVKAFKVDSVTVVKDAKIEVKTHKNRYVVEAAIPLTALGLKITDGLELRGDFGVTHSNPSGQDTALRTYWSNQATGIVSDEVFELKVEPRNWGGLRFVVEEEKKEKK